MEKKLRKSPVVIALYVIAALTLVYAFYLIGSAVSYMVSYYSSYSMTPGAGELIGYALQSGYQPIVLAVMLAAVAYTLNEVRALNPAYYATAEALAAAKAKKVAPTVEIEGETTEAAANAVEAAEETEAIEVAEDAVEVVAEAAETEEVAEVAEAEEVAEVVENAEA